jgi:hypothetical protein
VDIQMLGIGKTSFFGERRRHARFELSQALAYQWGAKKGTLRTVDLSLGGVKIQTHSPIPVDERLDLILLLEHEAINPVVKVVWSKPSSDGKYDVGVFFEIISRRCLKRLERFLKEVALREKLAKLEKHLGQFEPEGLGSKSLELDRLRFNFIRWLRKSYPWDYARYADRPEIGENEIRDFLRSKGFDQVNVDYLLESLRAG